MNIFQATVHHQKYQIIDYFAVLSQVKKGLKALSFENLEILVFNTSHCIDHIFSDLNWRRIWLRVSA